VGACLDDLAWPAVAGVAAGTILVVPLGSTEQHGPHLPVTTDTDIATALAARLAEARDDVVVAPAVPYGSSGEHAGFAGTLSVGAAVLEQIVVELARSADSFAGVVLVCGHGGNAAALASAIATLRTEGRRVLAWVPRIPGGDAHAGRTETSLMLALRPAAVTVGAAEAGDTRPIEMLMPALRECGVAAVSANGVLGDPTGASADEGRRLMDALAADLTAAVAAWRVPTTAGES
jgi:creatinine amidohydrolase